MNAILCADDDAGYLRLLRLFLEHEGYEVLAARDGLEALEILGARPDIALVVLDVMMPEADGYQVCGTIRTFSDVPVLMLTALGDERHEIRGMDSGADDYLPKPFTRDLLRARVQALLRRSRPGRSEPVVAGGITLDASNRSVTSEGVPVSLSFKEFELLRMLMERRNEACGRAQILDRVWGYNYEGDPRTLDTHVKSLRKKLGPAGDRIIVIRSVGYSFRDVPP